MPYILNGGEIESKSQEAIASEIEGENIGQNYRYNPSHNNNSRVRAA